MAQNKIVTRRNYVTAGGAMFLAGRAAWN